MAVPANHAALCFGQQASQSVCVSVWVLASAGLRVLIYSGDHDMCVPHTGSEAWTRALGLKVKHPWRPWQVNDQVRHGCRMLYSSCGLVICLGCSGWSNLHLGQRCHWLIAAI